jgi:His-Xaa-Ser system protein HxsD
MSIRIQGDEAGVAAERAGSEAILLDAAIHPAAAVTRACYALADIATFDISTKGDAIAVRIFPAQGMMMETATDRFRTSLIDFTVRENIEARTKGIRDLIWQTAFGEIQKRPDL